MFHSKLNIILVSLIPLTLSSVIIQSLPESHLQLSSRSADKTPNKLFFSGDNWRDCGGPNATIRFADFQVPPMINLSEPMKYGAHLVIVDDVIDGTTSQLEIWRQFRLRSYPLDVRIPCIGWIGSCNYDFCKYNLAPESYICHWLKETANQTCDCPMKPGNVIGHDYEVKLSNTWFSYFVKAFLPGQYRYKWQFFDANRKVIGCVSGESTVV